MGRRVSLTLRLPGVCRVNAGEITQANEQSGDCMTLSADPEGFVETPDGTLVHFVDLDLHAEALHSDVDDPVVLIHGLGCSWHHWSRQIGWIAHSRRAVAVVMRGGGGKTRWTQPGWSTADMAADVHAVVTELGLRRPAIVGCSMGGTIALQYALDYPADISRLAVLA